MLSEKELELLKKIQKKSVYENKFFKKRSEVKWFDELKKRGYFNPNPDTQPYELKERGYYFIPEWNVLPYLERVSEQVNIPGNEKYIEGLLEIIKNVTDYHVKHGKILDNYRTWWHFVKILCNLPNDKIPQDIIDLIPVWLDSKFDTILQGSEIVKRLLPKFLTDDQEDIKKAEQIIKHITTIKTVQVTKEGHETSEEKKRVKLVVDPFWLKEAFDTHAETIDQKCSRNVIDDLVSKVRMLLERKEDGTYTSFSDEPEYALKDPLEMLTYILKRILLAKAKSDTDTTKEILRDFLNEKEYLYFLKMALFIIGQVPDDYSDLFWEALETDIGDLILEKTLYLGDELKHLLKNIKGLDEHRETLKIKIEQATKQAASNVSAEDREKYIALHKQEIYEALSHDEEFKKLYEEMKKITGTDAALHSAIGKIETHWGDGTSPLSKEEIIKMPNNSLAEYLVRFKTKDPWKGPTVGGLAEMLYEVTKERPEKFVEDFTPFKDTGFVYIYKILNGILEAWRNKVFFNWGKLFQFIVEYIDREDFWNDKFIVEKGEWLGGADHKWIIGIIAELIRDGTRDDSWAFSEEYFEKAERIIFLILDNLKPEEDDVTIDYVTYTLNTPLGKTITALILLALRIARVKKDTTSEKKWADNYKKKYEELLNKKFIEGFTNLGRYLPNFYYLDKEWVKEKIEHLEDEKGSKYWEAFMAGYFSTGKVYDELYKLMRSHYKYGLEYDFKDEHDNEYIVQHISLSYLRGNESIDNPDSLFKQLLDRFNHDQISEIISFFWMQRGYLSKDSEEDKEVREKIIAFWRWLYERYKDKTTLEENDKKILSDVAKLAVLLQQINEENFKWLMLSAPYVHVNYNSPFFIEYLDELKDKGDNVESAKYIGKIFLKMLDVFTPDFDEKHIRSIVEFLYNSNAKKYADGICNTYVSRGYEFLRDLWEKYNRQF